MGTHNMSNHNNPPPDDTPLDGGLETPFDTALQQHFRSAAEPIDDGFSLRVMAALPARTPRRRIRWVEMMLHAHWTATSLAACGAAALLSIADARSDAAHDIAAWTLIGLLILWSIPSRWSRG